MLGNGSLLPRGPPSLAMRCLSFKALTVSSVSDSSSIAVASATTGSVMRVDYSRGALIASEDDETVHSRANNKTCSSSGSWHGSTFDDWVRDAVP